MPSEHPMRSGCPVRVGQRVKHPRLGWVTITSIDGVKDGIVLNNEDHKLESHPYWDIAVLPDGKKKNVRICLEAAK